jgi:hypothetical protein
VSVFVLLEHRAAGDAEPTSLRIQEIACEVTEAEIRGPYAIRWTSIVAQRLISRMKK